MVKSALMFLFKNNWCSSLGRGKTIEKRRKKKINPIREDC